MSELLAPAGSFEALVAAISNGADAIYLGMQQFGARAYASNFDETELAKAIHYAHVRNVKIYVTMNTIVFEDEMENMKKMIDFLYSSNVDGVIIQDLAVFQYVVQTYPDMEAHCSTQMGIDDLEGTLLFKKLGAKRVVLARETPIEKVKEIKKIAQIPLEIFIHGALCVSYSGNCLMSGLIGYRSGNRGRCVGSCRKEYRLLDKTNQKSYDKCYLLSMKDLNTIEHINELKTIDSLKIEGRMKEPYYVANVVARYREALDGTLTKESKDQLKKTFHRTFTKGYLFGEDKINITNIKKPNNYGYYIGKIKSKKQNVYELELVDTLNQNDVIRIDHNNQEINLTVVKLYDRNLNYINTAKKQCFIKLKEDCSIGDAIYKTKDYNFYQEIESSYPKEYRRFPIDITIYAYENAPLILDAVCEKIHFHYEGELLDKAKQLPTT
ncbi:MAG: U32 family peptidase [Anaeroplasmataceae bacterium]|nr:U32 family peptidase [Anaeroplasmataceae bacterium]